MVPAASAARPCAPVSCACAGSNSGSGMNALHRAVLRAADVDAARPAGVALVVRLVVRDVQRVVGRNVDAARPSELRPLLQEVAVLIEDLNAVVVAVGDEQPALRIQRERVRHEELTGLAARAAPFLDEGAVGANFTMRLFDTGSWPSLTNTLPLRRDDDVGGAVEMRRAVAGVRRCARGASARGRLART